MNKHVKCFSDRVGTCFTSVDGKIMFRNFIILILMPSALCGTISANVIGRKCLRNFFFY